MFPPEVVEWMTDSNLRNHKDVEMVLLKRHLILEIFIDQGLDDYFKSDKSLGSLNIPFKKKLELLYALSPDHYFSNKEIFKQINTINKLRNKLAHNFKFDHNHLELKKWAEDVLQIFPEAIYGRKTFRISVIAAFSGLCRYLQERTIELKKSKQTLQGTC